MKVENIKTNKDADEFVISHYFKKKGDTINVSSCNDPSVGNYIQQEERGFLDSLGWYKWIKKDFNNDRVLDLIYSGCINNGFKVLAFVSQSNYNYSVAELSASAEYYNPHFIRLTGNGKLLIVKKYNPDNPNWDSTITYRQMITADTLKYWESNFVDWRTKKNLNEVESIEISYSVALAKNIREKKLLISENRPIRFEKKGNISDTSYIPGIFIYEKEFSDSVAKFIKLVKSLPFEKLDSFYNAPYFDGFHWIINIKYKSGTVWRSYDHMAVAPYSLRLLYDFATSRFNDIDWKLIKIKEGWRSTDE